MPRFQYGVLNDEEDSSFQELQMEPVYGEAAAAAAPATAPATASAPAQLDTTEASFTPAANEGGSAAQPPAVYAPAPAPVDGVFANMHAAEHGAPMAPPKYEDDRLPSYGDVYRSHVIVLPPNTVAILEDLLVDGLPVGNGGTFILTLLVSWFLGLVGFVCAYYNSRTHAGRRGAQAGVGLQCINAGIYMRSYMAGFGSGEEDYDAEFIPVWISYVFLIMGWFIFFRACAAYFKARQVQHAHLSGVLTSV